MQKAIIRSEGVYCDCCTGTLFNKVAYIDSCITYDSKRLLEWVVNIIKVYIICTIKENNFHLVCCQIFLYLLLRSTFNLLAWITVSFGNRFLITSFKFEGEVREIFRN